MAGFRLVVKPEQSRGDYPSHLYDALSLRQNDRSGKSRFARKAVSALSLITLDHYRRLCLCCQLANLDYNARRRTLIMWPLTIILLLAAAPQQNAPAPQQGF